MNLLNHFASAVKTLPAKGRRNILKVFTLGVGLAVGLVLASKVCFEQTFDDFYDGADRICTLNEAINLNGKYKLYSQTSGGIAPRLKEYLPQIEEATRFTAFADECTVSLSGSRRRIDLKGAVLADSSLFRVLDRKCLAGSITDALSVPDNALLSSSAADRIAAESGVCGYETLIGQRFTLAGYGDYEMTVSGIYESFPLNSSYRPDLVVSMPSIGNFIWDGSDNLVGNDRYRSFIKLRKGADISEVNGRFPDFAEAYLPMEEARAAGYELGFVAKPFVRYHNEDENQRNMTMVLAFVAFALLLTSTLNYLLIVLSSAITRGREMALRKCLGSGRGDTCAMMFAEATVHTLLALCLAVVLIFAFRDIIGTVLGVNVKALFTGRPLAMAIFLVVILTAVNTLAPAAVFNRIPVAAAFRNWSSGRKVWKLALLAVEFASAAFLAVVLGIISLQYGRMTSADLGFDCENVAMVTMPEASDKEKLVLMNEIRALPDVEDAAFAYQNPFAHYSGDNVSLPGEDRQLFNLQDAFYVDSHYFKVLGIGMAAGRGFEEGLLADAEVVVDRSFAAMMKKMAGWEDVVGRSIDITSHGTSRICGMIEDIHNGSFIEDRELGHRPMAIFYLDPGQYSPHYFKYVFVRYHHLTPEAIDATREVCGRILADQANSVTPFRRLALDNCESTLNTRNAILLGGTVVLIIALLGLIGYTIDEARRRGKEIAVRRVNGAQFSGIRLMFLKDVMAIALPSIAVGCLIAGIVASRWESQFSVQVGLPWWVFVLTFVAVTAVTALVSDAYVRKIANANPAESIKTE